MIETEKIRTEQARYEARLRSKDERFRLVFGSIMVLVILLLTVVVIYLKILDETLAYVLGGGFVYFLGLNRNLFKKKTE